VQILEKHVDATPFTEDEKNKLRQLVWPNSNGKWWLVSDEFTRTYLCPGACLFSL
jgi:hypothetical protein